MLNIHRIVSHSKIYGPGDRTVIWFQGCSIHCKGCINPHLWSFKKANLIAVDDVVKKIDDNGVTFVGGEPLDQPSIFELINALKKQNIGIILFTGYSIKTMSEEKMMICKACDVVISEPFEIDKKNDSLYLMGSENQILTINSTKYSIEDFKQPNSMEVIIGDTIEIRGRKNADFIIDLLTKK